jgi:hypothetical protein
MKDRIYGSKAHKDIIQPVPYSIYVVITKHTRALIHWRGYKTYERAKRLAGRLGGIVSSAKWMKKYGNVNNNHQIT